MERNKFYKRLLIKSILQRFIIIYNVSHVNSIVNGIATVSMDGYITLNV